jgi:hypothetical protein
MSNSSTPSTNGPWRLLILDRDPGDAKWVLVTVVDPGDVQPALTGPGGESAALAGAREWVRGLLGRPAATLIPLHRPEVWRIDEN